mmetsp:Transcript_14406/g.34706  ORF Transcript_14406/g.34706 Transcript_14406/m.34706 type:complete len:324 (-) Transcript_14406:599-1570(-)
MWYLQHAALGELGVLPLLGPAHLPRADEGDAQAEEPLGHVVEPVSARILGDALAHDGQGDEGHQQQAQRDLQRHGEVEGVDHLVVQQQLGLGEGLEGGGARHELAQHDQHVQQFEVRVAQVHVQPHARGVARVVTEHALHADGLVAQRGDHAVQLSACEGRRGGALEAGRQGGGGVEVERAVGPRAVRQQPRQRSVGGAAVGFLQHVQALVQDHQQRAHDGQGAEDEDERDEGRRDRAVEHHGPPPPHARQRKRHRHEDALIGQKGVHAIGAQQGLQDVGPLLAVVDGQLTHVPDNVRGELVPVEVIHCVAVIQQQPADVLRV